MRRKLLLVFQRSGASFTRKKKEGRKAEKGKLGSWAGIWQAWGRHIRGQAGMHMAWLAMPGLTWPQDSLLPHACPHPSLHLYFLPACAWVVAGRHCRTTPHHHCHAYPKLSSGQHLGRGLLGQAGTSLTLSTLGILHFCLVCFAFAKLNKSLHQHSSQPGIPISIQKQRKTREEATATLPSATYLAPALPCLYVSVSN